MDASELQKLVQQAAEQGTENALIKMGLDTSDPITMQQDLAFLRRQRQTSEQLGRNIRRILIATVLSGVITMAVLGFQYAIKQPINM